MNFSIRHSEKNDITDIVAICDTELGNEYLTFHSLELMYDDPTIFIRVVTTIKDEIIGFSIGLIVQEIDLKKTLNKYQFSQLPKSFFTSKKTGIIKIIAVRKTFQNKGIGTQLIQRCIIDLKSRGMEIITAFAWKTKKGVNIAPIFDRLEFKILCEINYFWRDDSLLNQYSCSECGAPPCLCSTVIYSKTITA